MDAISGRRTPIWLAGAAGALALTACSAERPGEDGTGVDPASCGPASHERAEAARDELLKRYPLGEGRLSGAGVGMADGTPAFTTPLATDLPATPSTEGGWAVVALVPRGSALAADGPDCLDGVPVRYREAGPFSAF